MTERVLPSPPASEIRFAELVKAVSDPSRLRIIAALAEGEFRQIGDLPDLNLHKSTMSHHLRTLREAGYTETRFEGRICRVRLRLDELDQLFPGFIGAITSPAAQASLSVTDQIS